jgi:hypothetical protein
VTTVVPTTGASSQGTSTQGLINAGAALTNAGANLVNAF